MERKLISDIKINEILKKIPHRYPIILVDRVNTLEPGVKIEAVKNVSTNEPFFQGHFPDYPVMPGVLMLESLAQACAILFVYSMETNSMPGGYVVPENGIFLFAGINNVRFKKIVEPGDQLILKAELVKVKKDLAKFIVEAYVNEQVVCSAEILSAYKNMEDL